MLCPYCGLDSDKSIKFCINCGNALPESAAEERPAGGKWVGFLPLIRGFIIGLIICAGFFVS